MSPSSLIAPPALLAALASTVSAHGYVSGVVSDGTWYKGGSPEWFYASEKPTQAGWYAENQDNGYVAPSAYGTDDITCHKAATPGTTSIPVTAGSSIDLQWTDWPESHHGPVISYLASCGGDCTSVDKSTLQFFKIDAGGLVDGSSPPGTWASDELISNNQTWTLPIPSTLTGNYVLRHEIIALHSAGNPDGAQNYPMCLNLEISGGSTTDPCSSGATCAAGTALYKEDDPGILVSIYEGLTEYAMPGPAMFAAASAMKKRAVEFWG